MSATLTVTQQVHGRTVSRGYVDLKTLEHKTTHVGREHHEHRVTCPLCGDEDAALAYMLNLDSHDITKEIQCRNCGEWIVLKTERAFRMTLEEWMSLVVACGIVYNCAISIGYDEESPE